jgi:hypothetical protein
MPLPRIYIRCTTDIKHILMDSFATPDVLEVHGPLALVGATPCAPLGCSLAALAARARKSVHNRIAFAGSLGRRNAVCTTTVLSRSSCSSCMQDRLRSHCLRRHSGYRAPSVPGEMTRSHVLFVFTVCCITCHRHSAETISSGRWPLSSPTLAGY